MADQAQRDRLIAALTELGGSAGNGSLRDVLQWDHSTYEAVKDELVAEGMLGKGRGRGGSLFLIGGAPPEVEVDADDSTDVPEDDDDEEDGDDDEEDGGDDAFTLTIQEEAADTPRRQGKKRKVRRNADEPPQVVSYRHTDMRSNNPEVGMVHPENDPDQPKTQWAYDPHIDPALQFDVGRARIEALIDDALVTGDAQRMCDALAELKRLQAPYLNWTGKAERTSFEVDTVSLHVHERVDPATILAQVRKRLKAGQAAERPCRRIYSRHRSRTCRCVKRWTFTSTKRTGRTG